MFCFTENTVIVGMPIPAQFSEYSGEDHQNHTLNVLYNVFENSLFILYTESISLCSPVDGDTITLVPPDTHLDMTL